MVQHAAPHHSPALARLSDPVHLLNPAHLSIRVQVLLHEEALVWAMVSAAPWAILMPQLIISYDGLLFMSCAGAGA
jgi:hypothetical protein